MTTVTIDSPIGPLALTASDGKLTAIRFVGAWSSRSAGLPADKTGDAGPPTDRANLPGQGGRDGAWSAADEVLQETVAQLAEYFRGERRVFDLPMAASGEDFSLRVWEQISAIGYGRTVSYGQIAEALGDRSLSQAVGGATGSNPLPIVVPCHRVVGSDGSLTGFGGGLDRKRFLLALEEDDEARAARLF